MQHTHSQRRGGAAGGRCCETRGLGDRGRVALRQPIAELGVACGMIWAQETSLVRGPVEQPKRVFPHRVVVAADELL